MCRYTKARTNIRPLSQEVSLCEWNPEEYPPEVGRLEASLAGAGYRREGCAESHCGWTCIYLHDRLRQRACSISAFSIGPVVAVEMELQPEREEPAPGGPEVATAAGGGGGGCIPLAEPWHVQQRHRQQQEEHSEEAERRAQLGGVQSSRLRFALLGEGTPERQAAFCSDPWSALNPWQHPQPSQQGTARHPQHAPHVQDINQVYAQQPNRLCLAGCHLEPFDQNAPRRMRQLRVLLAKACERRASHLVVMGDFNMHEGETQGVLDLGLQVGLCDYQLQHVGHACCMLAQEGLHAGMHAAVALPSYCSHHPQGAMVWDE